MRKEDGELTQCPSEVMEWWHRHFNKLLNKESIATFSDEVLSDPTDANTIFPVLNLMNPLWKRNWRMVESRSAWDFARAGVVWWSNSHGKTPVVDAGHLEEGGGSSRLEEC